MVGVHGQELGVALHSCKCVCVILHTNKVTFTILSVAFVGGQVTILNRFICDTCMHSPSF